MKLADVYNTVDQVYGERGTGGLVYRETPLELRGTDEKTREATFVVATEAAVEMWHGRECLRMSGVDLVRYRANPILLDAHNGSTVDNVLGSAVAVQVEGRVLVARYRYATTPAGERAWTLVREGHLRTVSVGYRIDRKSLRILRDGEHDGEGEARVIGPCAVVGRWEVHEVSMAPVPADKDATLRRSLFNPKQETTMADEKKTDEKQAQAPEKKTDTTETIRVGDQSITRPSLATQIREIAPTDMREFADDLILEDGMTIEIARKRLREERAKRNSAIGTPEAPNTSQRTAGNVAPQRSASTTEWPKDVTDEVFARSFKGGF